MDAEHLKEEAVFADGEYASKRGNTYINQRMFRKYARPRHLWDWRQRAALLLGNIKDKRLLDYGCGQGEESAYFAKLGAKVTGIDVSQVGLEIARARARAHGLCVDFRSADCLETPFADGSFDIIHGHGILHHIGMEAGLTEVRRLLTDGGIGVFLEPLQSFPIIERPKEWLSRRLPRRLDITPVTSGEENLRQADIARAVAHWSQHSVHVYHLTYRIRKLVLPEPLWPVLLGLDFALLGCLPFLRRMAGAAVIYIRK